MKYLLPLCLFAAANANIFDTIGHGIVDAANTVGHGVVDAANTVGHGVVGAAHTVEYGVVDAANTVGHGVVDAANTVGHGVVDAANTVGGALNSLGPTLGRSSNFIILFQYSNACYFKKDITSDCHWHEHDVFGHESEKTSVMTSCAHNDSGQLAYSPTVIRVFSVREFT